MDGVDVARGPQLTVGQCRALVGSLVGGLCQHTDAAHVRAAIRWWAKQPDDSWRAIAQLAQMSAGVPGIKS